MDIETTAKVIKNVVIKLCRGILYMLGEVK